MIQTIRHKGLRLFYEAGNGSRLPKEQLGKIRRILTVLDAISVESDIKSLGSGIHAWKGEYKRFWSLSITGNYRIIFVFKPPDVLRKWQPDSEFQGSTYLPWSMNVPVLARNWQSNFPKRLATQPSSGVICRRIMNYGARDLQWNLQEKGWNERKGFFCNFIDEPLFVFDDACIPKPEQIQCVMLPYNTTAHTAGHNI